MTAREQVIRNLKAHILHAQAEIVRALKDGRPQLAESLRARVLLQQAYLRELNQKRSES